MKRLNQKTDEGVGRRKPATLLFAKGFTLLELMIVITIILILIGMAAQRYDMAVQRSREAVLKHDLQVMREAIDNYTLDKQAAPQSLDDLQQAGYLRDIPDRSHHADKGLGAPIRQRGDESGSGDNRYGRRAFELRADFTVRRDAVQQLVGFFGLCWHGLWPASCIGALTKGARCTCQCRGDLKPLGEPRLPQSRKMRLAGSNESLVATTGAFGPLGKAASA